MEQYPGKQLFIDDFFIESLEGAHRVLNRPQKQTVDAPLELPLDRPWDKGKGQPGRVIYNEAEGTFRLYYTVLVDGHSRVCALDSSDGLHWERPDLRLVEIGGSKANNVTTCPPGGMALFWDPYETDEGFRWKRIDNQPTGTGADGERAWQAFRSRDGYDWEPFPPGPHNRQKMMFNFGSPAETFGGIINPDARYVLYSQRGSSRRTRILGRRDSDDGLNWSGLRTVIDQDLDDPPGTEFYAAAYDTANRTEGGLHILMLYTFLTRVTEPYRIEEPDRYWGTERGPEALSARVDGFIDTQLAASRDTVTWRRYREPLIPRGEPGAWDWGMLYSDAPILHDGKLWIYYTGHNLTHNGRSPQMWDKRYSTQGRWGKGLALLRPDGYVSVEAESFAPGVLTTHRFRQESGGSIRVNVDASVGELRYEVLEDTGEPIPGYTAADCDPIRTDALDAELTWNGKPGWPAVSEDRQSRLPTLPKAEFYIKLRFHLLPGTKLYSLTLDPPEVTMWRVQIKGRID